MVKTVKFHGPIHNLSTRMVTVSIKCVVCYTRYFATVTICSCERFIFTKNTSTKFCSKEFLRCLLSHPTCCQDMLVLIWFLPIIISLIPRVWLGFLLLPSCSEACFLCSARAAAQHSRLATAVELFSRSFRMCRDLFDKICRNSQILKFGLEDS